MPSISYRRWRTIRAKALDEMAEAHVAIGGSARGRRYATQQINRAYAVLLASQFQGFCRDLHSECVEHVLGVLGASLSIRSLLQAEMFRGRLLDRGNAKASSLGADFGRLGIDFWTALEALHPSSRRWKASLEFLNEWRNAIVHEDFTSAKLSGIMILRLSVVRRWRNACRRLARAMDELMNQHLQRVTGVVPW